MIHLSERSCRSCGNAFCGFRQKIKLSKIDIKRLHDFEGAPTITMFCAKWVFILQPELQNEF